jgi:hypothetical protein
MPGRVGGTEVPSWVGPGSRPSRSVAGRARQTSEVSCLDGPRVTVKIDGWGS